MARTHIVEPSTAGPAPGGGETGKGIGKDAWHRLWAAYFRGWRRGVWRRGIAVAGLAVVVSLLMLLHSAVPNRIGNLGSLAETFLPWLGLVVPVVLVLGLIRRSATALTAVVLPAVVWSGMFGGLVLDKRTGGGDVMVATHNVGVANTDPAGTGRKLAASGADILALEEMTDEAAKIYESSLAGTYAHHAVEGSVGLWSKYPMTGTKPLDDLDWGRSMRTVVETPHGEIAVYVVHLMSVRVRLHTGFDSYQRDLGADATGARIMTEPLRRVVLLGDFNGATDDRSLSAVTSQMRSTQDAAGQGFGFTWPSSFPVTRIDQIMVKGVKPTSSWTLPKTGSDHLPIAARLAL
ncbi:endonuclease/exonuclease/phosphatase family protein [Streptomyces sp. NPDC049040]|uniref:endonuclease/exonuclease/phosphatase family protein n=1 Tax=Streptomyces sp. NPDC049040 TaxID=3365593 RepID=UPI003713E58B